jgi:hypothetical protein
MVIVTVKLTEEEINEILISVKSGELKKDFKKIKEWIDEAKNRRIIETKQADPKKEYIKKIELHKE